jgi:hypothetical protein
MALPIEFQIEQLMHRYDPIKAHEYYIKTRKLKGRKSASDKPSSTNTGVGKFGGAPKHLRKQVAKASRSAQRKKLAIAIHDLEQKLNKLEILIRKKAHEEASDNRKSKAKKERSAKEKDKPKSAAEKAKLARENKKYRDKHQQEQKTKARSSSGSGSSATSKKASTNESGPSSSDLKAMATRVRGQIAVAKHKLAAL